MMRLAKPLRALRVCSATGSSTARRQLANQAATPIEKLLISGARLTHAAHEVWSQVLRPGDLVVDATCGNGHDTVFLAKLVGPTGTIFAFDVQNEAIDATLKRLNDHVPPDTQPKVVTVQECHSHMLRHVGEQQACMVVFNLGYLPSSSKVVKTQQQTTVRAVEAALQVLSIGGLLSVLAYTGHAGGFAEYEAVKQLLREQPAVQWVSTELQLLNRPTAPIMLLAWRQA